MKQPRITHSDIVTALRNPAMYGEANGSKVEMVETHAAIIFLVGNKAVKIKKPVQLPYLDFSTLRKRKAALENELRINKPNAPQIYIDVVPIVLNEDGELALDSRGQTVDWALRMNRFPDDALLSHAIEAGVVDNAFFDRLADELVRCHSASVMVDGVSGEYKMRSIVDEVAKAYQQLPDLLPPPAIKQFRDLAETHLEECSALLDERATQGFVRQCHGDLHLGNIIVLDDQPLLFDAIEFSAEIATVDMLYDLAFLLMDLCHVHQPQSANRVLNSYLSHSGENAHLSGLQALPLFLACRAGIRAMTAMTRLNQAQDHNAKDTDEVLTYFGQALSYLQTNEPRLVVIGGFSGTGKTSVARELATDIAQCPGAIHLRTDVERKRLFGMSETSRLPSQSYTQKASDQVYNRVYEKASSILNAGQSVVVDAVFMSPLERIAIAKVAADAGVSFSGIWLEADEEKLVERVTLRTGDASDANSKVVQWQISKGAGEIDWQIINANGALPEVVSSAIKALKLHDY